MLELEKKFRPLEESLWKAETRFDLEYQENIFAEDFFEFGRSGKSYNRSDSIRKSGNEIKAKLPLDEFQVFLIDENTVLITYISEVRYDNLQKSNRSSIWMNTNKGWQIRFHQGTPIN